MSDEIRGQIATLREYYGGKFADTMEKLLAVYEAACDQQAILSTKPLWKEIRNFATVIALGDALVDVSAVQTRQCEHKWGECQCTPEPWKPADSGQTICVRCKEPYSGIGRPFCSPCFAIETAEQEQSES